jgi:hypothetical protein
MCCCFPAKCLKFFIFIACILILGVGAVLIWGGYQVLNLAFLKSLEYSFIGYIIIACGAVLIVNAFLGFLGAWKEKKLFLSIFIFFGLLIGIVLIAVGAGMIYARGMADDYLKTEKDCIDNFKDAEKGYNYAGDAMCRLYCPCKADNDYIDQLRELYKDSSVDKKIYAYSDIGAKTIVDCDPCIEVEKYNDNDSSAIDKDTYNNLVAWVKDKLDIDISKKCSVTTSEYKNKYFTSSMRKFFPLLRWVENSFDCSGLCTAQLVFMFSDADNGKPSGSCRKELNDWVQENFLTFGIVGIIFGVYLLLVVMFSCTICCCKKKPARLVDGDEKKSHEKSKSKEKSRVEDDNDPNLFHHTNK